MRLALLLTVSLLTPGATAQEALDIETYARRVLDVPLLARSDEAETLATWTRLLKEHPEHPLSEATLFLLMDWLSWFDEPSRVAEVVLALDTNLNFDPAARRQLVLMQRALRQGFVGLDAGADVHPDYQKKFRVLGPLPPHIDALHIYEPSPVFSDPGFDRAFAGIEGEERWLPLERSNTGRLVRPADVVREQVGQVFLATEVDAQEAGHAWLEIEARFPDWMTGFEGGFPGLAPGYAWSWNGEPMQVVDRSGGRGVALLHAPVTVHAGVNRLVLRSALGARARFAVRVIRALPEWSSGGYERALGQEGERGAYADALFGLLAASTQREALGIELLQRAVERAPEDRDLRALLALATSRASYLPDGWRLGRARQLVEAIVAEDPLHLAAQLYHAEVLVDEDREEEAIEVLRSLEDAYPNASGASLQLHGVLVDMGLDVLAEEALERALERTPESPRALETLARHLDLVGRSIEAAELMERAARASGSAPSALVTAAEYRAAVGQVEPARALYREVAARDASQVTELVEHYIRSQSWDRARESLEAYMQNVRPSANALVRLADIALAAGNKELERTSLEAAHGLRPSDSAVRERLRDLDPEAPPPSEAFFAAHTLSADEIIASYDATGRDDSVVVLLDSALVFVFSDGAYETLTQNVYQARDLEGCAELGKFAPDGDVIALNVIKASGERREPVQVDGEFVMPGLEPGDFVEATWRTIQRPRRDGSVRLGAWFFASISSPFVRSRYVLSVPTGHPLRLVERNPDGVTHAVSESGGRTLHVFERKDVDRVELEASVPPQNWFLPWIEFSADDRDSYMRQFVAAEVQWYTRSTSELADAVRQVIAGIDGQEDQARALHAFVRDTLDQRGWSPTHATQALLERGGNPSFLYAALLHAAGIDADLIWSRAIPPAGDPEPDPPFARLERKRRKQIVRVRPNDGPEALCDVDVRRLPYGQLTGNAPGAEGLLAESGESMTLPERPLSERPHFVLEGTFAIDAEGGADVEGTCRFRAGLGYLIKDQVRQIPKQQRTFAMRDFANRAVPGMSVEDFELEGLDEEDVPFAISATGRVKSFLDREGGAWTTALPFPALGLRASFPGEGDRLLPFFQAEPLLDSSRARLVLPAGWKLESPPETTELECPGGGSYRLSFERDESGAWIVTREVAVDAFVLEAERYPEFLEFCTRVDGAERVRLRFVE